MVICKFLCHEFTIKSNETDEDEEGKLFQTNSTSVAITLTSRNFQVKKSTTSGYKHLILTKGVALAYAYTYNIRTKEAHKEGNPLPEAKVVSRVQSRPAYVSTK